MIVTIPPLYSELPFRRPPRRNGNRPMALCRARSIGPPEEQTSAPALVSGQRRCGCSCGFDDPPKFTSGCLLRMGV
jgi:hypothetical protein